METLISGENTWGLFAILTAVAAVSIRLEERFRWAAKTSGCVLALIGMMILSNFNVVPTEAPAYDFVWDYVVPLSIPLLLFNADIRKIWRGSGRLMIIYLISGLGTLAGAFCGYVLLRDGIPDLARVVPMMVGTYTGGSVNLVAMADAFKAPGDVVSACVVADNLLMALYFFALAAAAGAGFFLSRFRHPLIDAEEALEAAAQESWTARPTNLGNVISALVISLAVVAVSVALAARLSEAIPRGGFLLTLARGLLGNKYLILTTVSVLLATLFPSRLGALSGAQETGMFLMHIFFAVIGVPASIRLILTQAPLLLLFCAIIVLFNMAVSFGLGKLLNFSLEEIIIASNANIGGPTTAAAMALSRGWTGLIVPAILVGTLGYVLGNYYGIFAGTCVGLG